MKFLYACLTGIILLFFTDCTNDKITSEIILDQSLTKALQTASATGKIDHFILPNSNDFENIPQDQVHNPLTEEKVALGKLLFFETGLALSPKNTVGEKTYSCASCHVPSAGFRPGNLQGIADGGIGFGDNGAHRTIHPTYVPEEIDAQGVRPLSLLNVAFVENTTWNGRFGSGGVNIGTEEVWALDSTLEINHEGFAALESQNIEGLDLHRMEITEEVLDAYGYRSYFDAAFADYSVAERYTKKTAAFAISAYLRTLLTNQSPFQYFLKGDTEAMTNEQKAGALVFFRDANCYLCHREKNLGSNSFYALGVNDLYQTGRAFNTSIIDRKNLGRGEYSFQEEDMFKFKVPQLYNLGDAPFFFHGSSKETVREVVEYFNNGIPENANVPQEQIAGIFRPLQLTDQQMEDLTTFLETGLQDPNLNRYQPEQILSGYCFPNNDHLSKIDLDCE